MANTPPDTDLRLVRSLYPAALVREIDELVLQGHGGYQTRQEFLLDAAQNHILEVKYGSAAGDQPSRPTTDRAGQTGGQTQARPASAPPEVTEEVASTPPVAISNGTPIDPLRGFADTELRVGRRGTVVEDGLAVTKEEPVLGLHNRDFPSIWAAALLANQTAEGPVPLSRFLADATRSAWRYAESLRELEHETRVKLRALFPTNFAKPQSAEEGFKAFAIGSVAKKHRNDGKVDASGPLFSWGACQLVRGEDDQMMIGLTTPGYELLEGLDGLSLRWPHEPEYAERFLAYLRGYAAWDWSGFERLLAAVVERPTRVELAQDFKRWHPEWSDALSNTNAAGFVARGREWGLLEPKLIDGTYALTEFGHAQRAGAMA